MTNHSEMQVDCFWAACPHLVHFLLSSWTNDDVVVQRFPSWSLAAGSLTLVRTQFLTGAPTGEPCSRTQASLATNASNPRVERQVSTRSTWKGKTTTISDSTTESRTNPNTPFGSGSRANVSLAAPRASAPIGAGTTSSPPPEERIRRGVGGITRRKAAPRPPKQWTSAPSQRPQESSWTRFRDRTTEVPADRMTQPQASRSRSSCPCNYTANIVATPGTGPKNAVARLAG
jgi:hypothetical protein